ncbi:putative Gnk2-like domain-containing protein [Helianthus anomalus]
MDTKSLISLMLLLQAFINGVNPALPPGQQSSICSKNGDLNSNELLKSRDVALDKLKNFEPPYTGDRMTSYQGITAKALCPPKIKMQDCSACVKETIPTLLKSCPKQKEGATWSILPNLYCMVRYADHPKQGNIAGWAQFSSKPNNPPTNATAGELENALNNLANTLKVKVEADRLENYGSGSISYGPGSHSTLYGSMHCIPTISVGDCKKCLSDATNQLHQCCTKSRKQAGRVFSVNCAVWYSHTNFLPKTLQTISTPSLANQVIQ